MPWTLRCAFRSHRLRNPVWTSTSVSRLSAGRGLVRSSAPLQWRPIGADAGACARAGLSRISRGCLFSPSVFGGIVADAASATLYPMGEVNNAIADGVSIGRIADHLTSGFGGALAGDDQRMAALALFDQIHHLSALCVVERGHAPIVNDQDLHAAQLAHPSRMAAIEMRDGAIGGELGREDAKDRAFSPARRHPSRAGRPTALAITPLAAASSSSSTPAISSATSRRAKSRTSSSSLINRKKRMARSPSSMTCMTSY